VRANSSHVLVRPTINGKQVGPLIRDTGAGGPHTDSPTSRISFNSRKQGLNTVDDGGVYMCSPGPRREVGPFILDTGASGLVITQSAANALGLTAFGEVFVSGVSGKVGRSSSTRPTCNIPLLLRASV
jgi:predicted aspartyl protease